jgi:hypothetical protein
MVIKPINSSEEFVYRVCKKSFLSLWSYLNPQGKSKGKELCDILVVVDPDIIIISVKEIKLVAKENQGKDYDKWHRHAIDESIKQIYGAEKWLKRAAHIITKDGALGVALPNKETSRIHRVALAFGGKGNAPIKYGDFGKGFVHVLDEISFQVLLDELDTVQDFAAYLYDKEQLCTNGPKYIHHGGEEDLLATYLAQNRSFPTTGGYLVVEDGIWEDFRNRSEYRAKKEADQISYVWDRLIETVNSHITNNTLEFNATPADAELVVRTMAKENRFCRRLLGKAYDDFIRNSNEVDARIHPSLSGTTYVFLALSHGTDRQERSKELFLRCFVARGLNKDRHIVVGIATEKYLPGSGFSLDLVFLYKKEWNDEDQKNFDGIRSQLGYFVNPRVTEVKENEYPSSE